MKLCNIKIINSGRNEYVGSIIIDDNQEIFGLCTEKNYDNKDKLLGHLISDGIYIEIQSQNETIPILAKTSTYFPKKSIALANYFSGSSLDAIKDNIYIEITNVKSIEQKLLSEYNKNKQLIKK